MDTTTRLEMCLPIGSATEAEMEKSFHEAIDLIEKLREALELVDDLGSFRHLLKQDD